MYAFLHQSVADLVLILMLSRFPEKKAVHLGQSLDRLCPQPSLRDLTLHAPINKNILSSGHGNNLEDPETLFKWPRLSAFGNLRKLQLFGLEGNMQELGQDIANILLASPQIKNLGLSIHLNSYLWNYGRHVHTSGTYPMLLNLIVDAMAVNRPDMIHFLDLEDLTLGLGAYTIS